MWIGNIQFTHYTQGLHVLNDHEHASNDGVQVFPVVNSSSSVMCCEFDTSAWAVSVRFSLRWPTSKSLFNKRLLISRDSSCFQNVTHCLHVYRFCLLDPHESLVFFNKHFEKVLHSALMLHAFLTNRGHCGIIAQLVRRLYLNVAVDYRGAELLHFAPLCVKISTVTQPSCL